MAVNYMTREGLEKLKAQVAKMKNKDRKDIADEIAEARAKGDLSENAEYHAAKEAQGHLEAKIAQLEDALANARVLEESDVDISKVSVLTTVEIKEVKSGRKMKYTLVSEKADPAKNESYSYSFTDKKWTLIPEWNMSLALGAGDITSTAEDLTQFMDALFNGQLLKKTSVDEMTNNVTWSKYSELQSSTILVIIASLVFAMVIGLVDYLFKNGMQSIYQSFGS